MGIRVNARRDGSGWTPEQFDEFLFADDFEVRRLDPQYRTDGFGVPLIALRRFHLKDLEGRTGQDKFLMPGRSTP